VTVGALDDGGVLGGGGTGRGGSSGCGGTSMLLPRTRRLPALSRRASTSGALAGSSLYMKRRTSRMRQGMTFSLMKSSGKYS
jgi:hypothetical protein